MGSLQLLLHRGEKRVVIWRGRGDASVDGRKAEEKCQAQQTPTE